MEDLILQSKRGICLLALLKISCCPSVYNNVTLSCFLQVNEFLAGAGTDAPDVDDENIISRPSMSYDDMWAKTLLETAEVDVRLVLYLVLDCIHHYAI